MPDVWSIDINILFYEVKMHSICSFFFNQFFLPDCDEGRRRVMFLVFKIRFAAVCLLYVEIQIFCASNNTFIMKVEVIAISCCLVP